VYESKVNWRPAEAAVQEIVKKVNATRALFSLTTLQPLSSREWNTNPL